MSLAAQHEKDALERWNQRPRAQYRSIRVEPVSAGLGAEVFGIDLAQDLSAEQLTDIRNALSDHLVLAFRDQNLDNESHKRFARHFGTLHQHRLTAKPVEGEKHDPEVLSWKTNRASRYTAGEAWHADVTCDPEPLWGSLLRLSRLPESGGGDTLFANTHLLYELLSPSLQAYLQTLTAVHDGAQAWTRAYGQVPADGRAFPRSEHPLVARHPFTGRPFLFVNYGFTQSIPQLTRSESDALLELLYRHIERSVQAQVRLRWAPGTLIFWDNWATQHHAVWDYYPYERWGERVSTLIGQAPKPWVPEPVAA